MSHRRPPGFTLSSESYLQIEEAFHLPAVTLESIHQYQGVYSDHWSLGNHTDGQDRIGTIS